MVRRLITVVVALMRLVSAALQEDGLPRGVRYENETWVQEQLQTNAKHLAEYEKNGLNGTNGCTLGGVFSMPICFQICDEWCWATVSSMTADFYQGKNQCAGLECQMPTREFGQQCCPYTNSCNNKPNDPATTCNKGGTSQQMADATGAYAGGGFSVYGPFDQATLDNTLNSKRPVMITVSWQGGGGHALMVGGCDNGRYYLHDPWGWYSSMPANWQSLSYDQLLSYVAPNGGVGKWTSSITWSLDDDAGHRMVSQHREAKAGGASEIVV
jgi:hypothetical protein